MQTKGSLQIFTRSKQAIWLLTTNDSLLLTSNSLYVWYKGLGHAGNAHAVCQNLTAIILLNPCLRFAPDFSVLEGHVLGMSENKKEGEGLVKGVPFPRMAGDEG